MDKKKLFEKVRVLGLPLLETEENIDANVTLSDVVKSKDIRLWEGFPVLLMNISEKGLFDYYAVKKHLAQEEQKTFHCLLLMSALLYETLGFKFSWMKAVRKHLSPDKKNFSRRLAVFKKEMQFKIGTNMISSVRLISTFQNYLQRETTDIGETFSQKEDLSLEYALSQIFSPKQKEIFMRKFKGEVLSKTDREYFSRRIKKKVAALANERLHQISKSLLTK